MPEPTARSAAGGRNCQSKAEGRDEPGRRHDADRKEILVLRQRCNSIQRLTAGPRMPPAGSIVHGNSAFKVMTANAPDAVSTGH